MNWEHASRRTAAAILAAALLFCQPAAYAGESTLQPDSSNDQELSEEPEDCEIDDKNEDRLHDGVDVAQEDASDSIEAELEYDIPDLSGAPIDLQPVTQDWPDEAEYSEYNEIITRSGPDEPYYEIVLAPDIVYGMMTSFNTNSPLQARNPTANIPRKISTLSLNDTVMVPLANGMTLKFRVMAKEHYKYGSGVILMSTQTTATVKYKIGNTINGEGAFHYYLQISNKPVRDDGAFINSLSRDYLTDTFYNQLHPKLKPFMKRAAQGEKYTYSWWGFSTHSNIEMTIDHFAQRSNDDLVFIPSTYEVSRDAASKHEDFGSTWGQNTNWSISNGTYFHLRDRIGSNNYKDFQYAVTGHKSDGSTLALYISAVDSAGNISLTKAGYKPSTDNMVEEIMVPCILLDNNTMVFNGANGTEITFNSPPSTPSTINASATVSMAHSGTINYSWDKSADPDGDAVVYVLEYAVNGSGSFKEIDIVSGTSYSLAVPKSNPSNIKIRIKARDSQGAESDYSYSEWTSIVYNSPPTTPTGLTGAATINSWSEPQVLFNWNPSTDPDGDPITYSVEKSVNGGTYVSVQNDAASSFTHPVSIPNDTTVQIRARASDGKEYSDYSYSGVTNIIHDIEAPTIQLVSSPDASAGWVRGEITIMAILTDALSGLKKLVVPDGVTPKGDLVISGQSTTKSFKTTENGIYAFTVTDNAGNSASDSIEIPMIDNVPPTIEYSTSVPEGQFTNTDVTVNLALGDTLSGLSEYINPNGSEPLTGNNAQRTFTVSSNSIYPFTIIDAVSNMTTKNVSINMIDRIKPLVTMTPQVTQWTNGDAVTINVSASDDYSGVLKITLPDGTDFKNGTQTIYAIYENGIYSSTATDKAGNISDAAAVNYQLFDRTPPTITSLRFITAESLMQRFFSLFGKIVSNKNLQMEIAFDDTPDGNDGESGVKWIFHRVLNIGGEIVTDWTVTPAGAALPRIDGEVNGYVEVVVEDAAGNRSETAKYEILVDKTPPVVSYTVTTTEITNHPVTVTLTASDEAEGSGIKGWILPDGGVLAAQPQIDYIFTENAIKTFTALDNAGNKSEIVIRIENIDLYPPAITSIDIEEVTDGGVFGKIANLFVKSAFNTKIRVTVNATDDIGIDRILYCVTSSADISEDTEWIEIQGNTVEFEHEMAGVFHAKAVDMADNESATASRAIILDRSPPILAYSLKDRENKYEPVIIKITATDDTSAFGVSGISNITTPLGEALRDDQAEYSVDKNGLYTFTATDYAGNMTSLTIVIDNIAEIMPVDFDGNRPVIDAVLHATGKRTISEVTYSDMLKIIYLDMSAKGLVNVPEILKLAKNITHLDLRGNELRDIPEFIYSLCNLKYLDLSNNNLTFIGENFSSLQSLESLDISLNYLIDYDCPLDVRNYRNEGNYTMGGRDSQYSFRFNAPESEREYAGNTAALIVEWSYSGQPLENGLESHRKALYRASHDDHRTYRPAMYEYMVKNGQIKTSGADYARIYLPASGVMTASLMLGELESLTVDFDGVDVLRLPEPEIYGFDAANGIVFLKVDGLDTGIRANIRAVVSAMDEDGGLLETSEVMVGDPENIKVPMRTKLQKGQTVTAMLINHDIFGSGTDAVNESNGDESSAGAGQTGAVSSHTTAVKHIIIETTPTEVVIEKILEIEKEGLIGSETGGSDCIQDGNEADQNTDANGTTGHQSCESGNDQADGAINEDNTSEIDSHDEDSVQSLYSKILMPVQIPAVFIPVFAALPLFGFIFPRKKRKRGDEHEKH